MRITASWSGSSGSAEYKYVARWSAPCGEFPLGRCALNQSQTAVNEDERLGRIRPYRSGLDTSMPHTSFRRVARLWWRTGLAYGRTSSTRRYRMFSEFARMRVLRDGGRGRGWHLHSFIFQTASRHTCKTHNQISSQRHLKPVRPRTSGLVWCGLCRHRFGVALTICSQQRSSSMPTSMAACVPDGIGCPTGRLRHGVAAQPASHPDQ